MDYAQRFVSKIDFLDYQQVVKQLEECHAFGQPSDAMGGSDKLTIPPYLSPKPQTILSTES